MTGNKLAGFNFKMYSVFTDKEAIGSTKSRFENLCKNSDTKSKKRLAQFFLTLYQEIESKNIQQNHLRIWSNKLKQSR